MFDFLQLKQVLWAEVLLQIVMLQVPPLTNKSPRMLTVVLCNGQKNIGQKFQMT